MRFMTAIPLMLKNNNSFRILGNYTSAQQTTLNYMPSTLVFLSFFGTDDLNLLVTFNVSADLRLSLEEKVSHFLSGQVRTGENRYFT